MKTENKNRNDLFNNEDLVKQVQEKLQFHINAVKCFERSTHKCAYVLNCQTMKIEYISANALAWCGVTEQQILNSGVDFFYKTRSR